MRKIPKRNTSCLVSNYEDLNVGITHILGSDEIKVSPESKTDHTLEDRHRLDLKKTGSVVNVQYTVISMDKRLWT